MKLLSTMAGLMLLLCAAGAQAQMYKWVDDKGVTHFSDQPPPPNAKKVSQKDIGSAGSGPALPYELAEAVRNFPVTLYTSGGCSACDQGRALLQSRGIPFKEKTVSSDEDHALLIQAGSQGQVPLLLVGPTKLLGFEAGQWNGALTDANYPAAARLPAGYQQAKAETAAPRGPSAAERRAAAERAAAEEAAARAEERAEAERARRKAQEDKDKPAFQF
jgi:glutaredoxin